LESLGAVRYGFLIRRALESPLAGLLPIRNGLRGAPCLGVVMRQQFRLLLTRLGKPLRQHLRNLLVVLASGPPEQRRIGGILHQGVLEAVARLRRGAPPEE